MRRAYERVYVASDTLCCNVRGIVVIVGVFKLALLDCMAVGYYPDINTSPR